MLQQGNQALFLKKYWSLHPKVLQNILSIFKCLSKLCKQSNKAVIWSYSLVLDISWYHFYVFISTHSIRRDKMPSFKSLTFVLVMPALRWQNAWQNCKGEQIHFDESGLRFQRVSVRHGKEVLLMAIGACHRHGSHHSREHGEGSC